MSKAREQMDSMIHEMDVMAAQDRIERIQAAFPEIKLTPIKARTLLVIFGCEDSTVIEEALAGIEGL